MSELAVQQVACTSCGALLAGQYCSQCGDERFTPEKRTVRHFLASSVISELLNVDGRIWRTLRLLITRPGFLAAEHALGRRRPYVHPLRILLTTIVLFALTMAGTNFTLTLPFGAFVLRLNSIPSPMFASTSLEGALSRMDPYGLIERMLVEKTGVPVAGLSDGVGNRFKEILVGLGTPLSFTVVLLLAMLLYLLFNRRRPLFLDHLVFAMNYYSFALIVAMLSALVIKLFGENLTFSLVLLTIFGFGLWRFVYMAVAVRRFYLPGARRLAAWPAALSLALLLHLSNAIFITAIQLACGAIAVWLL